MLHKEDISKINNVSWNKWVENGCIWTLPISHEEYMHAKEGLAALHLTPIRPVPSDWYNPLVDKKVLGLASAGGQQCPIFAAQGADVTVFDISEKQLDSERIVSLRERYDIEIVRGDITERFPFNANTFDLVFHPVSNSYVEDIQHVWNECFRVLKPGGILLSGFANPTIYLYKIDSGKAELTYNMPYNPLVDLDENILSDLSKTDGIQFGHSFDEQIRGQLHAGFAILDFYQDYHPENNENTFYDTVIGRAAAYLSKYMPIYFATKSIKAGE